ncbi:hypothetical protein SAMD00023378_4812 [Ralstonia sp. NT80]|nr:hypothetical protein SAMD00023378_4812 [Ralstonia sp. NT80]
MFFGYQSSLPDYATFLPRHGQTVEAAPGHASTWQTNLDYCLIGSTYTRFANVAIASAIALGCSGAKA